MCEIFVRYYRSDRFGDIDTGGYAIYNELDRVMLHSSQYPWTDRHEILLLTVAAALRSAIALENKAATVWLPKGYAFDLVSGQRQPTYGYINAVNQIRELQDQIDVVFLSAPAGHLLKMCPNRRHQPINL